MNQVERHRAVRMRGRGGFTLVETLVTIAVPLVMLPVIVEGFTIAGRIARLTRQRAEAVAIAQSKMDELVATGTWQQGGQSGEESYRQLTYTWTSEISSWDEAVNQQMVNLQRLDVTVTWPFSGSDVPQKVQLTTVVYLPDTSIQTAGSTQTTGRP